MVTTKVMDLEAQVWDALATVPDPEIPAVSVVDMGMIREVVITGSQARIVVLPTFTGCPALPIIKSDVAKAVRALDGVDDVKVDVSFTPPWTSDRITADGRKKLEEFGLAPPTGTGPVLVTQIGLPKSAICPFCGSKDTHNENPFGPTPCRALYYCNACRNPFEQFKPV
ncbi:MAG: ring,2-phenylacetyl-CoA epoxidase subunit PaaD [Actinomycetota bacterium]|jgi:ring-1,2-phenylacetyl-CoA epoxidase subunit PaaD|nr:ring,2-phenylacetyl-CoA epoxidase subunit PaaD [Actinomycetota bacterium]